MHGYAPSAGYGGLGNSADYQGGRYQGMMGMAGAMFPYTGIPGQMPGYGDVRQYNAMGFDPMADNAAALAKELQHHLIVSGGGGGARFGHSVMQQQLQQQSSVPSYGYPRGSAAGPTANALFYGRSQVLPPRAPSGFVTGSRIGDASSSMGYGAGPGYTSGRARTDGVLHNGDAGSGGILPGYPAQQYQVQQQQQNHQQQTQQQQQQQQNNQQQRRRRPQRGFEDNVKRTVYISYIDQTVTEEQLANVFSDCGKVVDCRICGDPNSAMRFAFIEFTELEAARLALSKSNHVVGSSPLRVLPSKTAILPVNKDLMPRSTDDVERCSRTVYIANIDKMVDKNDVRNFFEQLCGKITKLRLLGDYAHSTRISFIEFAQAESAMAALNCSGALLGSLPIRVSPSKTPVRSDSRDSSDRPGAGGTAAAGSSGGGRGGTSVVSEGSVSSGAVFGADGQALEAVLLPPPPSPTPASDAYPAPGHGSVGSSGAAAAAATPAGSSSAAPTAHTEPALV